jgi:hypothetical protein
MKGRRSNKPILKSKLSLNKKITKTVNKKSKSQILAVIERIGKINKKGVSNFISIIPTDLRKRGCKANEIELFKSNNGVPYLRKDSPLCRKYNVTRKYHKSIGSLIGFQLTGFNNNMYFSRAIPQDVRRVILEKYNYKCILCGSKDRLEIDHKNGRYDNIANTFEDFQLLCKSCNDKKRERCKTCKLSGQRFNVQQSISNILYKVPFTCGTQKYTEKIGCKGCFLYDIEDFYKKHDKKNDKKNDKINDYNEHIEHEVHVVVKRVFAKNNITRIGKVVYK